MRKPYILAIDDDLSVLRAIERDLKAKFSPDIASSRWIRRRRHSAQSAASRRGDRVALFLVDQRMPQMSGTVLQEVTALQPDARRVLLTAYADSAAAIDAINKVKLNHYLLKPWEPPEQHLYPVLADQLEDWQAGNRESFDGVYVIGTRWAPETHRLKDFLAKSQVPYRWIEPDDTSDPRSRRLWTEKDGGDADGYFPGRLLWNGPIWNRWPGSWVSPRSPAAVSMT
jgi:thioredoxin reductase (NADPH)